MSEPSGPPAYVWVVTDERYSGCDSMECACSGILGQVFATEQTAKQYADIQPSESPRGSDQVAIVGEWAMTEASGTAAPLLCLRIPAETA